VTSPHHFVAAAIAHRWRTALWIIAVLGLILSIAGPIRANRHAIEESCHQLTAELRRVQGIPARVDAAGRPVPTPTEVYTRVLLRDARPADLAALHRSLRYYPPSLRASCEVDY
jgi:hypothetical protein